MFTQSLKSLIVNIFGYRTEENQVKFMRMQTNLLRKTSTLRRVSPKGQNSEKEDSAFTLNHTVNLEQRSHGHDRRASKILRFDPSIRVDSSIDETSEIESFNRNSLVNNAAIKEEEDSEEKDDHCSYNSDDDS